MEEDPNGPRKPLGNGKEPPSPFTLPTCASSIDGGDVQLVSVDDQREFLQRQVVQWGLASGTSVVAVTFAYVPAQIITAFLIVVGLFVGFMHSVYQRARLEASEIRRRGLGHHLSPETLDQLINVSFHDFMVNGTFVAENIHLLLYFIPGIEREQLARYVDRLIPRHRQVLHRQGLGHFFGETFMRFLVGDMRYEQLRLTMESEQIPSQVRFRRLREGESEIEGTGNITPTALTDLIDFESPPRRTFNWTEESPAGSRQQSASIPISETRAGDGNNVEEEEEDLDIDGEVVTDAVLGSISTFSNWALNVVRSSSSNFVRRGLTISAAATAGIGILGMVIPRSGTRSPGTPTYSTSAMVVSSIIASVGTAGVMYFFQPNSSGHEETNNTKKQTKP